MGEMADMALDMCIQHEAEWDEYYCGNMSAEDAYDAGITDSMGYADSAQLDRVSARNPIPTLEALDNQLSHAVKDLSIAGSSTARLRPKLNAEAIKNLAKASPTCNICRCEMTARNGRYGKFYFCSNQCDGQGTVSDKYWQSVRSNK